MSCAIAFMVTSLIVSASPMDQIISNVHLSQCLQASSDDLAVADFSVVVVMKDGKEELDIGIRDHSFTLAELEEFFRTQQHKGFIIVKYPKGRAISEVFESKPQMMKYFQNVGYKRILVTRGE